MEGALQVNIIFLNRFAITSNFSFYLFGEGNQDVGQNLPKALGVSQSTINLLNTIGADTILAVPKIHFFPVNVGFEYYILTKKIKPYVGFDVGLYTTHTESVEVNLSDLIIGFFRSNRARASTSEPGKSGFDS